MASAGLLFERMSMEPGVYPGLDELASQVAAARMHEFHRAPPPHEQWMHGRRRQPGVNAPKLPGTPGTAPATPAARRRAPKPPAAALTGEARIEAARNRQKKIDIARGKAEKLATLTQLIYNDAEPDVFQHNLNRMNLADDPAMKELLRPENHATPQKLLKAIDRVGRKLKLEPIRGTKTVRVRNQHGEFDVDRAPFDRSLHTLIADEGNVPIGTEVDIAEPGYFADIDGERVRLFRADVMRSVDEVVPPAPKRARAPKRSQTAAVGRMHEFHPAPPPHVQSSHGNRSRQAGRPAKAPDAPAAVPKAAASRKRAPKAAEGGKPRLADVTGKPKASNPATVAAAQKIYGGTFGGLTTKVNEATVTFDNSMVIAGDITNNQGHRVGTFTRTIARPKNGEPYASHGSLYLSPKVQGQGFAEGFNANAINWYRANGVKSIRLYAGDDVGGYAWARAGYDWADESTGKRMLLRALAAAEPGSVPSTSFVEENMKRIPPERLDAQRKLAGELFDRSESAKFGTAEYPTPYEVSQLGRWPGAGKDDMWAGKAMLLGSGWKGVRYL